MPRQTQVVLITGATRGIGRACALHLARRGHRVLATGRDPERLAALEAEAAGLPLATAPMDVNDGEAVRRVVEGALAEHRRVDALVNNAGYGLWGALEDLALDEVRAQLETNLIAPLRLCQAVLPAMRAGGFGTIVNVGSVSGLIGSPAGGAYAASKAALLAMSRVLRMETRGTGVRVVLIEPGLFATDFQDNQHDGARVWDDASPYLEHTRRMRQRRERSRYRGQDPERVARRVRQCIEGRRLRPRYSVGLDAWFGTRLARFFPDAVVDWLVPRVLGW